MACEVRTDFTSAARPMVVIFLPSQMTSLEAILSSRYWKSTLLSCHTESGSPKYLIGKVAVAAGKLWRIVARFRWPHRIGTTTLFWKFVARYESPKFVQIPRHRPGSPELRGVGDSIFRSPGRRMAAGVLPGGGRWEERLHITPNLSPTLINKIDGLVLKLNSLLVNAHVCSRVILIRLEVIPKFSLEK